MYLLLPIVSEYQLVNGIPLWLNSAASVMAYNSQTKETCPVTLSALHSLKTPQNCFTTV